MEEILAEVTVQSTQCLCFSASGVEQQILSTPGGGLLQMKTSASLWTSQVRQAQDVWKHEQRGTVPPAYSTDLPWVMEVVKEKAKQHISRKFFTKCLRITPKRVIRAQQTISQLLKMSLVFLFQKYLEWDLWIFLWCVKCYGLRLSIDLPLGSICHSYTLLRSTYIGWGPKGKQ